MDKVFSDPGKMDVMPVNKPKLLLLLLLVMSLTACGLGKPPATQAPGATAERTLAPVVVPATPTASPTATPPPATLTPLPATPTSPPVPSPTGTFTLTPVPQPPVWVRNPTDQTLVKVDPATDIIQARVPLEGGVSILAATSTALWAANDTTLYKLSPEDGTVIAKTALSHPPVTIAVGTSAVWLGLMVLPKNLRPGTEYSPSGQVARIDPDSLAISNTVDLDCAPKSIGYANASVWVTSGCFDQSAVDEIDPKTLAVTALTNPPGQPANPDRWPAGTGGILVASPTAVWMVSTDGSTVSRVDPASHKILQQSDVLGPYNTVPVGMAYAAGQVWLALPDGKILGLDPSTLALITSLDLQRLLPTVDFAASPGALWVNDPTHAILTRIDPAAKAVTGSLSTGSPSPTPTP